MKALLKRAALQAKGKKGFTLVEVIVVLVILAILMAIAIPALTGYISKARDAGAKAETKVVATAAQSVASNASSISAATPYFPNKENSSTAMSTVELATEISTLTGDAITYPGTPANANKEILSIIYTEKGKLETLKYRTSAGIVVTYTGSTNSYAIG